MNGCAGRDLSGLRAERNRNKIWRTGCHIELQQLPAKCQAAVVLQYWEGLSYEEIAERLGISTHMVKKYLTQALAHCRRRMARWG